MGIYRIVPVPSEYPRHTVTFSESRGPVLSLEGAMTPGGWVYLGDREVAEVFVSVLAKIDTEEWKRSRAVLEAQGWVHPDRHAGLLLEQALTATLAEERATAAEQERDAVLSTVAIVNGHQAVPSPESHSDLQIELESKPAAAKPSGRTKPKQETTP